MALLPPRVAIDGNMLIPADRDGGVLATSSRDWMQNKLTKLQIHLELDPDLTRFQPPQVPVVNADDGSTRIILLTTAELLWKHRAIQSGCFGHTDAGAGQATPPSNVLQGSDFRVSERYRCLADHRGQVQGGVGFIFEGKDIADGSKVAIKFFHKAGDDYAASARTSIEIITCLRLHHGLHSTRIDQEDERDLAHVIRLRDVLVDAPIFEDCSAGLRSSAYRATAMVFDWADGGDAHNFVRARGGITPAEGARVFKQVLRGLRCLHRRGIVHRDIKPENILLTHDSDMAKLCDFGFAKHVPSIRAEDLRGDPTTCYQSPERWLACHSIPAARARSRAGGGAGVRRRDETADGLFASDIFSAGVSLFLLVAYHAILARLLAEDACGDAEEGDESKLPALNVFQDAAGGDMFGLLQAGRRTGFVQERLWTYWEVYGLQLPAAMRGLLDGLLHPIPSSRFSMEQAFTYLKSHPEVFSV